jgi:hypothetical protein
VGSGLRLVVRRKKWREEGAVGAELLRMEMWSGSH